MRFQKGNKFAVGNSGRFTPGHKRNFLVDWSKVKRRLQTEEEKKKRVATILERHGIWPSPFRGKELPSELKDKLSKLKTGENHWNWKGGITPINGKLRNDKRLKEWRRLVLARDKNTCVFCGAIRRYLSPSLRCLNVIFSPLDMKMRGRKYKLP